MKTFKDLKFKSADAILNGVVSRLHFDNGFGVSVVCHDLSYGGKEHLYELAVLHNDVIHYDNKIAKGDVLGYLTEENVSELMIEVQNLEKLEDE